MTAPKPIALTQIDEAAYDGPEPQPLVVVGAMPGGGGGGDVASVNGKTGEVVLEASDILKGIQIVPGSDTALAFADSEEAPTVIASIDRDKVVLQGVLTNAAAVLTADGLTLNKNGRSTTLKADATTAVDPDLRLPASSGTLALTSEIPDSPADIGAATAAQGAKADSAVQPDDITDVVRGVNGATGIWLGTLAQYTALPTKDPNVLYITKD